MIFKTTYRYRIDLIFKLVLLNPSLINSVVGNKAKDNYTPWLTEWTNNTKSDILHVSNNFPNDNSSPPVLVGTQHTVDKDLIIRLMEYFVSVYRSNKKIASIVLVFVISSMKYNVSKKTTCNKNLLFLLKFPSDPWARSCYFVTDNSIESGLVF